MSRKHSKVSNGISITPVSARPADPENGDIIYNSVNNQFEKYQNGQWGNFSSTSDLVFCSYSTSAGPSIPSGVETTVLFGIQNWDSHNIYNTSTGEITLPRSGIGEISANCSFTAFLGTANTTLYWVIFKNGSAYKYGTYTIAAAAVAGFAPAPLIANVQGVAGDKFILKVFQNSGASRSLQPIAVQNYFDFTMI